MKHKEKQWKTGNSYSGKEGPRYTSLYDPKAATVDGRDVASENLEAARLVRRVGKRIFHDMTPREFNVDWQHIYCTPRGPQPSFNIESGRYGGGGGGGGGASAENRSHESKTHQ